MNQSTLTFAHQKATDQGPGDAGSADVGAEEIGKARAETGEETVVGGAAQAVLLAVRAVFLSFIIGR